MRDPKRIGLTILAALFLAGCNQFSAPPSDSIRVGAPAPPTRGTDADGVAFQLRDYQGKVVMLDFFGNW